MKQKFLIAFCILSIFAFSCKRNSQEKSNELFGIYEGVVPCADCSGIRQKLTLKSDQTFILESTYLGKDINPYITEGSFKEENGKVILSTEAPNQYAINEGFLEQLDIAGNEIMGEGHNYKLTKIKL